MFVEGSGARDSRLILPDSVQTIGKRAFYGCSSILAIKFSDNLQRIDESAFSGCTGLVYTAVPNGNSYILKDSLIFPDSLTSIEKEAFFNCYCVASLSFPKSLAYIGEDAFTNMVDLTSVYCNSKTTTFEDYSMGLTYYADFYNRLNDVVIYGYKNSTAQVYAYKYGLRFSSEGYEEEQEESTKATTQSTTSSSVQPTTNASSTESQESTKVTTPTPKPTQVATSVTEYTQGGYKVVETLCDYVYVLGDVNLDEMINVRDATVLQQYIAKFVDLNEDSLICADVSQTNGITVDDVTMIQEYIAHMTNSAHKSYVGVEKTVQKTVVTTIPIDQPTQGTTKATQGTTKATQATTKATTYKVTFTNNYRWGTVKCYAFNKSSGKVMATWPGKSMTYSYTNTVGEDVYEITISKDYDTVIFTDGNSQTVDISTGSTDKKYYISGGDSKSLQVAAW